MKKVRVNGGRPRLSEISLDAVNTNDFLQLHLRINDALEIAGHTNDFTLQSRSGQIGGKLKLGKLFSGFFKSHERYFKSKYNASSTQSLFLINLH